nr:MAG TPA: hypothetical protein [Caudoviricetes sp.]
MKNQKEVSVFSYAKRICRVVETFFRGWFCACVRKQVSP